MLDSILTYLGDRTAMQLLRDAVDVIVVYLMVYGALRVVRGTRAMQVGAGIGLVFVLYVVAKALQLVTVLSIMDAVIASFIIVVVILFNADIRRGLMRIGSGSQGLFSFRQTKEAEMIDEVVEACTDLARHRIGAIITFERDANLDEFVGGHKGHVIDSAVTAEMLVAVFLPEAMNKLHDGSVIIRDFRIARAGVFFPMPENRPADESFGSRHRAALGITEETDAVVVVVSEERGTISFCFNGNIIPGLDGPNLRRSLEDFFSPKARKKAAPVSRRSATPPPPPIEPDIVEMTSDSKRPPPEETVPAPLRASRPHEDSRLSRTPDDAPQSRREETPKPLRPRVSEPPPPVAGPPDAPRKRTTTETDGPRVRIVTAPEKGDP